MSQLTHAVRRSPRRAWLVAAAVLLALVALMLVWIGRAGADAAGPSSPNALATSVSNVPTPRADALNDLGLVCTVSPQFNPMPGTSETFNLGGRSAQPVIVLFEAEWHSPNVGTFAQLALTIDGVFQSGAGFPVVDDRPSGEPEEVETHGFNWVSQPLAPGTHTATIMWRDNGVNPHCVRARTLIVLHK
jgi:hypothetical protein